MSTLPKHLADQVQQYAEDNTETLEFEHGFKAGAAYLFSLDKILFQKVLDYFNLDTTNVPMELYKEVFQLLNPTSEQTAGSQEGKSLKKQGKKDLDINLPDTSAKEFADALVLELSILNENFSTHAMSDRTIFLQGKKEMLSEIIDYITKAKP